jgi:hypothetical protein
MFPDYLFLKQLDTDTDDMISRSEFLAWARDYAVQLKARDDQAKLLLQVQSKLLAEQAKIADLQAKLAAAKAKKDQKKYQDLINNETKALNAINNQIAGINKTLNSAQPSYGAALMKAMKK